MAHDSDDQPSKSTDILTESDLVQDDHDDTPDIPDLALADPFQVAGTCEDMATGKTDLGDDIEPLSLEEFYD